MAGAAGTRVQLVLAVPAPEAPRTCALVAVHQVLGEGRAWREPSGTCSPTPAAPRSVQPSPCRCRRADTAPGSRWRLRAEAQVTAGPPRPPALHPVARPPILTDVAVGALPAREAITVIATNQVFARESIKARLPFTLIGVCERDKGGDGPAALAAHTAAATSTAHSHAHTPRPRGPYPAGRWPPPTAPGTRTQSRPPGPRTCPPPHTGWRHTRRCLRRVQGEEQG